MISSQGCSWFLARILECWNHLCTVLNPNKTKALVVSRFMGVNPSYGEFFLSRVSIWASPDLGILGAEFDSKLTFEENVRGIVVRVYQRIGILSLVKRVFVDNSELLHCYYAFVPNLLLYCYYSVSFFCVGVSYLMSSKLLERQVYSVAGVCPHQSFCYCVIEVIFAGLCTA